MRVLFACIASLFHTLMMGDWMGYKIVYEKPKLKKYRFLPLQTYIAVFLLLFSVFVRLSWPAGREALQNILVSQSLSNGAEAVVSLLENLEGDRSISDAVVVFCQEILHDG